MRKTADPFYNSARWKALRLEVMKRDNYTCRVCGLNCKDNQSFLQVDHVMERKDYPAGAYLRENLRTLCRQCHTDKTFGHKPKIRPVVNYSGLPPGWE